MFIVLSGLKKETSIFKKQMLENWKIMDEKFAKSHFCRTAKEISSYIRTYIEKLRVDSQRILKCDGMF